MNSKAKKIIIIVIILVILFFVAVALAIGGVIAFAQFQCMQEAVNDIKTYNVSLSGQSVHSISISLPAIRDSWVHFYGYEQPDQIYFSYKRIAARDNVIGNFDQSIATTAGLLSADFKYNGDIQSLFDVFLGCPKYDISVYVPQNFNYTKVSITSLNANYEIHDVHSDQVVMSTTAGKLIAENIEGSKLEMTSTKGDISIDGCDISDKITAATTAGGMTVVDTRAGELELTNTGAGKISLTAVTTGTLTARIIKGDIITDRCSMATPTGLFWTKTEGGATLVDRFGEGSIKSESLVGNIQAEVDKSYAGEFDLSSFNGEARVDPEFNATFTPDPPSSGAKKGTINGGGTRTITLISNRGDVYLKSRG